MYSFIKRGIIFFHIMKRSGTYSQLFSKIRNLFLVAVLCIPFVSFSTAHAASLTAISDTMSRVQAAANSSHTMRFTTPTGATTSGKTLIITFPAGFNFTSKTIATVSFTHGASTGLETVETLAASPGASVWGAVFSGSNNVVLTLTSPTSGAALTAGDKVIITYSSVNSVNPSAGSYVIPVTGNIGDTGSMAVSVIAGDQIPVTASVDPSVTFTATTTTLALGTLASGSISSTSGASNLTIGTNGGNGYTIAVSDAGSGATAGLYSSASSTLIPTSTTTLSAGTEGYGGICAKVGGSGSCTFTGTANAVTAFSLTPTTFASYGSKPAGTETYSINVRAAISTSTTAGSYADTLTVIGTGNF
jgi:hypothetical protein